MKPVEVTGFRWLPANIGAITLWPFIAYRDAEPSARLRRHEHYHWHHALRYGVLPWYVFYVALLPFYGGGERHPLEKPAYEAEE